LEYFEQLNMPNSQRALRFAGLLLCGLVSVFSTAAGRAEQADTPFIVDTWSTEEGLPQSSVISVIQTRDGYLWLGTLNGLVRFDGNRFTVFDENNTPGLNSGRIVCLFEDSHGDLWIGTETAGVALLKDGKIKNFDIGRAGHEGRLTSACEDSSGAVWLYTADAHLGRYQNGKMDVLGLNYNPPANCRMIVAEKSGPLWIGEDWGMFSMRPSNFHPPTVLLDQLVQVGKLDFILAGQRGGTWRLGNGRIQKWGPTQLEKDLGPYPWTNATVSSACEDKDGNLIVGTLGAGVFWYDANGKYRQVSTGQGLSHKAVLSLCQDREGNLWFGAHDGLNQLRDGQVTSYSSAEGLSTDVVLPIFEDREGSLWMGTVRENLPHMKEIMGKTGI